jgi:hypothetical protein
MPYTIDTSNAIVPKVFLLHTKLTPIYITQIPDSPAFTAGYI